jgi:hypothetical protein
MKAERMVSWQGVMAMVFITILGLLSASAAPLSGRPDLPDFDKRETHDRQEINDQPALAELKSQIPDAEVTFDETLGTPAWVYSKHGFLTGLAGMGRGITPSTLARFSNGDPYRLPKAFLKEHSALFAHGPEVLNAARVRRDFVTPHNGMRTVIWEQQVDAIPVFEALLIVHISKHGELISIGSHFLPAPDQAANAGTPNRAAFQAAPPVTARHAVIMAARNIGETIEDSEASPVDFTPQGPDKHQKFRAKTFKGDADVHLTWLPMTRDSLRLCWEVIVMGRTREEMFKILIDAETGEALVRHGLTENISDASYRVFTTDSPTPFSPGFATPMTNQPAEVDRVLVVTNTFDTNASPGGWINDGDNETTGNNVDAHLDRDADNLPDLPRPRGSPFRVFDFPLDLTQDPGTYGDACVVNLFYWNNWMHDKLYEFGFTEAAGNFQQDNFGRGGTDSDPVQADAQDGSGFNNANFSTPPDGLSGRMQMYIFNGPTPNRDGDFDSQVIVHEYTHGLSGRRVGGGVGISALQSRGLGEGWSDFYSLALLSKPDDDVNGNYPEGSYASYRLFGGLGENYYFGIRRYPYTTDMTKNPETFKDIDPSQAAFHSGIPRSPVIPNSPTEIHNMGEIWCGALWDARANLINKYGFAAGNHLILQLLTDAMNLTPANPNFIQARDAVIQADLVDNGGVNYHELWLAFARRGLGYYASSPGSFTTFGVVESYVVPDDLVVTPGTDLTASGTVTGPFNPAFQNYVLNNTGTNAMDWTAVANAPWVNLSATNGTLAALGGSTNVLVSLNAGASNLTVGTYNGIVTFTDLSTGSNQTRNLALTVSPPILLSFPLDTDPGWSRQGEWAFGKPAGQGGSSHGQPDPVGGATGTNVFGVNLNGDYSTTPGGPFYLVAGPLNFSNSANVVLQFQRWLNSDYPPYASASLDVSSNGTTWTSIFSNSNRTSEIADGAWNVYQYDISAYADNQPSAYVRWGYRISPGAFAYSGWNIDDIQFLGISRLGVSLPASATEGDGVLSNQAFVSVMHAPPSDLTINLTSSNPLKVTVPATATIPAGQTNAAFDMNIVDNGILDGTASAIITASAPGYNDGTNSMLVFDNETATLTMLLPAVVTEGDAPIQGTIISSAPATYDVQIQLASSDTNSIQVPASVALPAGQTSAVFSANIIDDGQINWDRNITLIAHVTNWTDGVGTVLVHDNESTNLLLHVPAHARESNGTLNNAGKIRILGPVATNVVVALASSDTNEVIVPPTVTIFSGQTSAVFNVTLIDDNRPDGPQSITVTGSALGFANGQGSIDVTDNETPPAPMNPMPPHLSTNNPVTVHLSWSPGVGEGVEQLINSGFESGDFSGWVVPPGTNGAFIINNGTVAPPGPDGTNAPFAGNYDAVAAPQTSPAFFQMYQDVMLPTNSTALTLTWEDRIRNFGADFTTNQQFRVEIRDTNDVLVEVVFSTQSGDPLLNDWTQRSADLSGYAGQTIRLSFVINESLAPMNVHLDRVSIRAASPPPTTYDIYFGTNPVPGQAEFIGNTSNTFWMLPQLSSLTTYYWQIVAVRASQAAGPIWQFSALQTLSIINTSLLEGNSGTTNALFQVTLSGTNSQTISVDFATGDGTAAAPGDYAATNGTLVFLPGETNKTIPVAINGNTINEPDKTFFVNLTNPVGAIIATNQGTGMILNDDNAPPTLAIIADQTVNELETLIITNSAADADTNEVLTYGLDPGAPAGAGVDPTNGVFSWTPTEAQGPGSYTVTVRVTDDGAPPLSDSKTFQITVNEVNSPPSLAAIPNQVIHALSTLSFIATATDTDIPTNQLTFSLGIGAPSEAVIDPSTGQFEWRATEAEIGTNVITVLVTDNGVPALSDAKTFTVTVVPRPAVNSISVAGGNVTLGWSAIPGKVYRVQYADDLMATWIDLPGDVTAAGPLAAKTDSTGLASQRFYRVLLMQ